MLQVEFAQQVVFTPYTSSVVVVVVVVSDYCSIDRNTINVYC